MALQFNPYPLGPWEQREQRNQRPDINQTITQPLLQGLNMLVENRRQQALMDLAKRKSDQTDRQFDYEYGTPIDPKATTPVMGKSSFVPPMPVGSPASQQGEMTASPMRTNLVERFNQWRSAGMPRGGAQPEFMDAMGADQRKSYMDQNSPGGLAEARLKNAQADYYENRPTSPNDKNFYFVDPSSRQMYDANMMPIDSAPQGATPRMLTSPGNSTEGTKRTGLLKGLQNSVSKTKQFMTPEVVAEMKGIRFSPGNIYSQLGSSQAKRAFSHLKNAISNELYLKSGATANPGELEEKALMYLPAGNDSVDDVLYRLDMLANEGSYFDPQGEAPVIDVPRPGGGGGGNAIYATNGKQRIVSYDNGQTWDNAR